MSLVITAHCSLLSPEDGQAPCPLVAVHPVLHRHAAALVVVPLAHQGGVTAPAGVCCVGRVRGLAAQGRGQLLEEGEVGQRPHGLQGETVRRRVERVVRRALRAAHEAHDPGRIVAHAVLHIEGHFPRYHLSIT